MLVEFRFQNFRLFRDEQTLSFVASPDNSLPENVITTSGISGINLLRSALVFGANASGKTTILDAINFSRKLIKYSAKNEPNDKINAEPFLFDEEYKSAPTSFEYTIILDNVRYRYGFTITSQQVQREWLVSYPKGKPRKLFERWLDHNEDKYDYNFSPYLRGEKEKLIEVTRSNALFLSVGATFNNPQLLNVYNWFSKNVVGINTREINEQGVYKYLAVNPSQVEQIIKLMRYADLGIVDISFIERDPFKTLEDIADFPENLKNALTAVREAINELATTTPEIKDRKFYSISMIHQAGDNKLKLPWDLESAGTHQLLFLSAPIFQALIKGNFIFIDEFDNSLHPLLLRELIKIFNNPSINTNNAQLLFNTHDTTLLSTNIFRRDQVWFVEKDKQHVAHLYSLVEYSPRKDEALEKGYLKGRYGAIPFFGEFAFGERDFEKKEEITSE
jgi:AAA15 family ATPase/GTPase